MVSVRALLYSGSLGRRVRWSRYVVMDRCGGCGPRWYEYGQAQPIYSVVECCKYTPVLFQFGLFILFFFYLLVLDARKWIGLISA